MQLAFILLLYEVCSIFLSSLTPRNFFFSFFTRSVQLHLFHPHPAPHLKTFQILLIHFPKRPSFSTIQSYAPNAVLLLVSSLNLSQICWWKESGAYRRTKTPQMDKTFSLGVNARTVRSTAKERRFPPRKIISRTNFITLKSRKRTVYNKTKCI